MVRAKTNQPAGDSGDGGAPKKTKWTTLTQPLTLSPALAAIVAAEQDEKLARNEIVDRLLAYIKEKNLWDPKDKQWFTPDKLMKPVFGSERIHAFGMIKYLGDHTS
jgi:upstream activation factor subunit UAF30